ncbi:MAG: beta-ketoacyl-ACP synthase 3 [Candidatus Comchoanobacterales bacterium]
MTGIRVGKWSVCLPKNRVSNHQLSLTVDTTDEWIVKRTGIESRYIATQGENTLSLSIQVARSLVQQNPELRDQLGLVIVATSTPWQLMPSTASGVHSALSLSKSTGAFDVNAACSGFVSAFNTACDFVRLHQKPVMLIGSETMSQVLDWDDRSTCVLFGDGAAGVIIHPGSATVYQTIGCDGKYHESLMTTPGHFKRDCSSIHMSGKDIFKQAVSCLVNVVKTLCDQANIAPQELSLLVPHQANKRILLQASQQLDMSTDSVIMTINQHANTSSASVPLAMHEALKTRSLKDGDWILLCAFGAGFSWAGSLYQHVV